MLMEKIMVICTYEEDGDSNDDNNNNENIHAE